MTRRPDPAEAAAQAIRNAGYTPLADIIEAYTARRETLGWSQRHVAQLLGVNQATIVSWERGRTAPPADWLLAWGRALDIDLATVPPYTASLLGALTAVLTPPAAARPDTINPNGNRS